MTEERSLSRRRFLELGFKGSAAFTGLGMLGLDSLVSAQPGPACAEDYRALVCVFLVGGADSANLIVPRSAAQYATYAAGRGSLAEPLDSLLPITPATSDGAQYGLNGQVPELASRFEQGRLAFVANLGPLVEPITRAELTAGSVPVPARLFSHNDQQRQWQLAQADATHGHGWCGRLADRIVGLNGGALLPTNTSLDGPVPLVVGATTYPFTTSSEGPSLLWNLPVGSTRRDALLALLTEREHALEDSFSRAQVEAIVLNALVSDALVEAPTFEGLFDASPLAVRLQRVAQIVSVRATLGMKRQIFVVAAQGFDTHDHQREALPGLFRNLSTSLESFQTAIEEINAASIVTTFTSSEFGRTLTGNGRGSDHGWGGHALVLGDGVLGGDIYGRMPSQELGGPDDAGDGRMIPTIAVDQFAATLSRWFGLPPAELGAVFPNLGNFDSADLGFLAG